ncbi:hypothetical protein JMM51_19460, partial [Rhodovulum sulfidophilum]|nr:hypothetical protein [Rhodovulum sulfidophilum]
HRDTRAGLWAELDALRRGRGMTALIVTHDPSEARALADRSVAINAGRLNERTLLPCCPSTTRPSLAF